MASSFQQQSRVRKMIYAGLIVGLLTGSMLYRKVYVEPLAFALQLRAESQGEVDAASSAARLMKIGNDDWKNEMRCLFDLSGIDPQDWNPVDFETLDADGRTVVNMAHFEKFCRNHPRLVRRLREKLFRVKPDDVVEFLKINRGI